MCLVSVALNLLFTWPCFMELKSILDLKTKIRYMHVVKLFTNFISPKCSTVQSLCWNICNILLHYGVIRTNSCKDNRGQSPWQYKQCTLNYKQRKHRAFYFTRLSDWMKDVKTKIPVASKWILIRSKKRWSADPWCLCDTFTKLALFVFQACTLAPAPPITVPPPSSSPPTQPLSCLLASTDWTGTWEALTCHRWLPWRP